MAFIIVNSSPEANFWTVERILTFQKAKLVRILFANDLENIQSSGISIKGWKPPETDYMEDSITKYLTLCEAPEFAVRATLFYGLCLKHQGLFTEAATSYIRMTNELSDLRSAMLLEQVSGGMVVVGQ